MGLDGCVVLLATHNDLPRRCVRLHFFNDLLSADDLANLTKSHHDSYRGFVVIRPLPLSWLGRSVLSDRLLQETVAAEGQPDSFFSTCAAKYRVNLAGNEISVVGAPWLQQDKMVSGLVPPQPYGWHPGTLTERFAPDFKAHLTPDITDYATSANIDGGRAMPSSGLTTQQIMLALRAMGYEPMIYTSFSTRTADLARRQVYHYVESSIPVILGLQFPGRGGHAVTVVGHTLNVSSAPITRKIGDIAKHCVSSDFCRSS